MKSAFPLPLVFSASLQGPGTGLLHTREQQGHNQVCLCLPRVQGDEGEPSRSHGQQILPHPSEGLGQEPRAHAPQQVPGRFR